MYILYVHSVYVFYIYIWWVKFWYDRSTRIKSITIYKFMEIGNTFKSIKIPTEIAKNNWPNQFCFEAVFAINSTSSILKIDDKKLALNFKERQRQQNIKIYTDLLVKWKEQFKLGRFRKDYDTTMAWQKKLS